MMQIERLKTGDGAGFDGMFALYSSAIEPSERKPRAAIEAYLHDQRCRILIAREGGAVVAFAMTFRPHTGEFWLLDYMAVDSSRRSQGLGTAMFRAALADASAARTGSPCLIEIDEPGAAVSAGNNPAARAAFYGRLGARQVKGLRYVLPLDVAGPPPPMQLLVHGMPGPVPKSLVRTWLRALYSEVYEQSVGDPRIEGMLQDLPDMIALDERV